jgi:preprotein translocase subunit SecD
VLAAKSVNLISAVILYYLAVGGVQGFAFTLGLTTIIDVAVVFWFTHPVMELITKVPFFRDGHRWSGLSPERLRTSGPRYAGAGRITSPVPVPAEEEPEMALATAGTSGGSTAVARQTGPRSAPATRLSTGPATGAPAGAHRMTIAERRAAERKAAAASERPAAPDDAAVDADRSKTEESR